MQWGDLITLEYGKPIKDKESVDGPIPVYGTNGQIGTSHLKPLCEHPSFILGRKGAYRGVHYSDTPFSVIDTAFYAQPISDKVDLKWAYYKFLTYDINRMDSGSAIPSTDRYEIYSINVDLPDLATQRKVVSVLELLDNKIQDNNKINDNLADIIQSVYQNRFSSTRSDVTAGVLADICSYSKDKVPVLDLNNSNYYSTENMQSDKKGAVDAATLPTIAQTTKCRKGDVLISNIRPYFKKIVYCQFDCGCSTDVLCFCPKESALSAFLFSTLYADHFFDFMAAGAKGTKMPRGDKQQIMTYPIYLPSADELAEFNSIAIPALTQMECSRLENTRLTALRDALLPKLMSGELDVSAVEL